MSRPPKPDSSKAESKAGPPAEREYEKSGCYPEQGRPFRIWALLGGLSLVVAFLAIVSALLNFILL